MLDFVSAVLVRKFVCLSLPCFRCARVRFPDPAVVYPSLVGSHTNAARRCRQSDCSVLLRAERIDVPRSNEHDGETAKRTQRKLFIIG